MQDKNFEIVDRDVIKAITMLIDFYNNEAFSYYIVYVLISNFKDQVQMPKKEL